MPKFVVSHTSFDNKGRKVAKFHYIKQTFSGSVVAQSIAFRVVSIYWYGVAPFPWYLHAKGSTPIGSACVPHTSPHSGAQQPPTSVTSLRSAHWLASDFHSWINSWSTVKPMFTQFDCQSNSSTNCRINGWTDSSSNCQIHTQTV